MRADAEDADTKSDSVEIVVLMLMTSASEKPNKALRVTLHFFLIACIAGFTRKDLEATTHVFGVIFFAWIVMIPLAALFSALGANSAAKLWKDEPNKG